MFRGEKISRRQLLARIGQAAAVGAIGFPFLSFGKAEPVSDGRVIGEVIAAKVGEKVLAEGGNAVDAAVAAALMAGVAYPNHCGAGGYGGHIMLALDGGKQISCIDFNTVAPAAAQPDMYSVDNKAERNRYGWQASGVPGTLAGLQLALDKHGTRSFRELAQPAIDLARSGFPMELPLTKAIHSAAARLAKDRGSAKVYLAHGDSPKVGDVLANPELAEMLSTLAKRNSVDSFYRGDIAQTIADAFKKNGGLVTAKDLAKYHARIVKPLKWEHENCKVYSAPLTAGGLTALEGISVLDALKWNERPTSPAKTHARLEALRLVWKDRLELLGDPEQVHVPVTQLLSPAYARILAEEADRAEQSQHPLSLKINTTGDAGTTNLSCADRHGNLVAVTLTHGGDFGAQVTVDGLGLTLGQGMYKFNPHPGNPNSPGPGKRPVHNMCPTIVRGPDKKFVAIGGAGGQMIPNAMFAFLTAYVLEKRPMSDSLIAPRLHTLGNMEVTAESTWPQADTDYLKQLGFATHVGPCARLSAVSFDHATGEYSSGMH